VTGLSWQGGLPTQVALDCGGETHWVRWDDGELVPLNHADAAGEQTLAALAGERLACFELIELWRSHADDLRVLALASRGPADPLSWQHLGPAAQAQLVARSPGTQLIAGGGPAAGGGFSQLVSVSGRATLGNRVQAHRLPGVVPVGQVAPGSPLGRQDPIATLLTVSGPLADRLVATVAATWADRLVAADPSVHARTPALTAALYGRATEAVRNWLGAPRLNVEVTMIGENDEPSASRTEDGVSLRLPFRWIAQVWGRGLAILLGHLVLAVRQITPTMTVLEAVRGDFGGNERLTITISER
jgi:hypothetical protein